MTIQQTIVIALVPQQTSGPLRLPFAAPWAAVGVAVIALGAFELPYAGAQRAAVVSFQSLAAVAQLVHRRLTPVLARIQGMLSAPARPKLWRQLGIAQAEVDTAPHAGMVAGGTGAGAGMCVEPVPAGDAGLGAAGVGAVAVGGQAVVVVVVAAAAAAAAAYAARVGYAFDFAALPPSLPPFLPLQPAMQALR